MRFRDDCQRGMTLLELLFVILIIGVLVSLLLPALQSVRSTARMAVCNNNLNQLILAVKQYEQLHGSFPPGVSDNVAGPVLSQVGTNRHHSWIGHILPQLNQLALYRTIDFGASVYHPKHNVARGTGMNVIRCPGSPATAPLVAVTHYAAVHHHQESPIDANNTGAFFLNSHLTIRDITDGLSHTLFIGESWPLRGGLGWLSGTRSSLRNVGTSLGMTAVRHDGQGSIRRSKGAKPTPADFVGGFGSPHKTVCGFAFGDGHVRRIAQTIDMRVMQQLGHRFDGQPLDVQFTEVP